MQHVPNRLPALKDESISKIPGYRSGFGDHSEHCADDKDGTIEGARHRHGAGGIFTVSVPLELQPERSRSTRS